MDAEAGGDGTAPKRTSRWKRFRLGVAALCLLALALVFLMRPVPARPAPAVLPWHVWHRQCLGRPPRLGGVGRLVEGVEDAVLRPLKACLPGVSWSRYRLSRRFRRGPSVVDVERAYRRAAGEVVGRRLAATFPGARVVIVTGPRAAPRPSARGGARRSLGSVDLLAEGLRVGLGDDVETVADVTIEVPAHFPGSSTGSASGVDPVGMLPPAEIWFTAEVLTRALEPFEGRYDLLVSTFGLPGDAHRLPLWRDGVTVAVAGGSIYTLAEPVRRGLIVAAVAYSGGGGYGGVGPVSDLMDTFDKRFFLVTPGTIGALTCSYPDLLSLTVNSAWRSGAPG